MRTLQFADELRARGLEPDFSYFFDNLYLERLYSGRSTFGSIVRAYCRRVRQLKSASSADLLWIEKEALPWLPWILERTLLPSAKPIVVDYDDAVFHRYDMHRTALVRWLLGHKLDSLMASAAMVTVGNSYLAERAKAAGARRVEIVPTVVDLASYSIRPDQISRKVQNVGWIGTPNTWRKYMLPIMPVLTQVAVSNGARILSVGAGRAAEAHPMVDVLPWSEESEVSHIHSMDIGIMPLTDTPWARGKCGYKLIQYMACGIPVIASPVGVNSEIVEHGVNGFLASSDREWTEALNTLLSDPVLRRRMGREGRSMVERRYSLQVWGSRVASLLRQVIA